MEDKILDSIQRLYQEEGSITRRSYEKKPYSVAGSTVRRYFGTWNRALEKAGIPIEEKPTKEELKEEIIESLLKCYEEEGKLPQRDQFAKKEYGFSRSTIESVFGSWSKALIEAKLKEDPEIPKDAQGEATRERILLLIKKYIKEKGDDRSFNEFRKQGNRIGHATIKKYFGSWDVAYDLAKFGDEQLYSKKEMMAKFNLPENFVRGLQHIPALKKFLVIAGKSGREGIVYKIPEEHAETISKYYNELKDKHNLYDKRRGWFTRDEALLSVYINDELISTLIEKGELIEFEDFVKLDRIDWKHVNVSAENPNKNSTILFLNQKAFDKFPLKTIGTLLKALRKKGIRTSIETLNTLRENGLISRAVHVDLENTIIEYYDVAKTAEALTFYMNNAERNQLVLSSYDFLNEEQQRLLDQYIQSRESGVVIEFNNFRPKRNVAHASLRLPEVRNRLANTFFSIICGRCGVDYKNGRVDRLPEETLAKINPDVFNITDVSLDDFAFIAKNRKTSTLLQRYGDLRPFYYWLLMRKDAEPKHNFQDYQEFDALTKNIQNFLNQFPKKISDAPVDEVINNLVKVFLTREELIRCKNLILKSFNGFSGLKYSAIWMLGATGIRPEEFTHLKLEKNFVLDENGFMLINDKGYGEMIIDTLVGKGSYSLSHPEYKLPIPRDVAEQINLYLRALYLRQGSHNPIGKGYFLRKHPAAPEKGVKELSMPFITKLRTSADFLDKEQRENLILKNTRSSMYTLMKKTYTKDDHLRENVKPYALYYQMRHTPQDLTTGEKFYLEAISREDYYAVLEHTINFPWDLDALKDWEIKHGHFKAEDLEGSEESASGEEPKYERQTDTQEMMPLDVSNSQKIELQNRINILEEKLQKIKIRDKNMTVTDWLKVRKDIEKEKKVLELKLKAL